LVARAYQADQQRAAAAAETPAPRKKKSTRGSAAGGAASSEPLDSDGMSSAISRAIEHRGNGRANAALEARIWRNIRLLDAATPAQIAAFTRTARTDMAQWIVTYHSLAPGAGMTGAPEPSSATAVAEAERRVADYEIAWQLLDSVAAEIRALPASEAQEEDDVMRKATEVCQLDLAHKQRRSDRLLHMYDLVRARADPLAPVGYSEEEFFTLWMLSPLVGRWGDFARWADFMHTKGQELDEFHHLAIQRADLTDYQQMYTMVKQAQGKKPAEGEEEEAEAAAAADAEAVNAAAAEPARVMWEEPSASGLDWSQWDVVSSSWSLLASSGTDQEAVSLFLRGKEPASEWRAVVPGINTLRQMGASARITSVVAPSLPVVGPCLRGRPNEQPDWFTATGSVLFRDHKHDLCRLNEQFSDFTRVQDDAKVQRIIRAKRPFEVEDEAAAKPASSEQASAAAAAAAAAPAAAEPAVAAEPVAAAAAADGAAEPASFSSDDAVASAAAAAGADSAAASDVPATAAAADMAAGAPGGATAPVLGGGAAPASVSVWDPSAHELWRGRYFFEQMPVSSTKPYRTLPDAQPYVRVEYEVFLKLKRNNSVPNVI
jgi:hypothetical protein